VIRVLLADDEHLIRSGFVALLRLEDDVEVVAEAASGDEALAMAQHHRPDVAVLDLQMPGRTASRSPSGCASWCRVRGGDRHQPRPPGVPQAGARRRRPRLPAEDGVGERAGHRRPHRARRRPVRRPELAAEAISAGDSPLTPREADVLELAADGAPVEEIAAARRAVARHGAQLPRRRRAKLGAANRHEAVHVARRQGWI
jgi:two-component system response regulator DesR